MSAFTHGFNHGFFHGMLNNMFGGWNMPMFWNSAPMFFTPSYMQGTFIQYPSVIFSSPTLSNVSVPNFTAAMPTWNSANIFQSYNIKPAPVSMPVFSEMTRPSMKFNVGDTFTVSKTAPSSTEKKSPSSAKPAKHWSDMSDSELKEIYGNYTRDITQLYKGDAEKLNKFLSGKGVLVGKGKAFMDAQKKYGISAVALIAICAHESGNGKSNLAKTKNNVGGIRLRGSNAFRSFGSVEACIEEMARLLKENYVNNNGRSLKQLYQINAKYCPASDSTDKTGGNSIWAQRVESIAKQVESIAA